MAEPTSTKSISGTRVNCQVIVEYMVLCRVSRPSLASQTFFVGGACGKGKRTSGNSCQLSQFSWNLKYSMKSRTLSRAQSCTRASHSSRACGEPVKKGGGSLVDLRKANAHHPSR